MIPTVAIVGSRQNTTYGYNIAEAFAKSFAKYGNSGHKWTCKRNRWCFA